MSVECNVTTINDPTLVVASNTTVQILLHVSGHSYNAI